MPGFGQPLNPPREAGPVTGSKPKGWSSSFPLGPGRPLG
jgi:hypothetical protein